MSRRIPLSLFFCGLVMVPLAALPPGTKDPGKIEGTASEEDFPAPDPDQALLSTITWPEEMKARVYASQPDALNVTAIAFDEQNRLYLAETHRFDRGIEDNRRNQHWLRDEIALTSTAERLAMYEKHAKVKPLSYYTAHSEKIRVLVDDNHDGVLDRSQLYAEGFNDPLDGTAAGIFAAKGKVYFACIPHVWMLEDTDGDLKADTRQSLQEGYGISVSLSGHDLNGFTFGPDGRIYFTIGDRGYNLKTAEGRHLYDQYAGAIFRMEPDGSGLEVVHSGLRNPKEIAFDQYGSAFSVDNNADMGDKARLVYMVEGANSGWNRGNQNLNNFRHAIDVSRRHRIPWMEEGGWKMEAENRPAAYLPPADHISVGPSGLTYNPGTGLAAKWDNNFFICDYRGGGSEIIAFEVQPNGAGFRLKRNETFIKGFLNTDVEFGYDGRLYASDFTGGWKTYDLGNIFVFENPEELAKPDTQQVRTLFAEGFEQRPAAELAKLLRHQDQRVRQRAQFALAKDPGNRGHFLEATSPEEALVTRLHGIWGLGQLARLHHDRNALNDLAALTKFSHWRIRAQAAQALGDANPIPFREALLALLKDEHPNVQMLAAIALGKARNFDDILPLTEILAENKSRDPYLRHGAVQAIYTIAKADKAGQAVASLSNAPSPAVRRGAILVLRKLKHPGIAKFLDDSDPSIVIEAIQAINDASIEDARPALAALTGFLGQSTPAIDNRIINAIFRVGGSKNLKRLLTIAKDDDLAAHIRIEALFALQRWQNPPAADPTTGKHRPVSGKRSLASHRPAITTTLNQLLEATTGELLAEVIRAIETFDLEVSPDVFLDHFTNRKHPSSIRLAVLETLEKIKPTPLKTALGETLSDPKSEIRTESFAVLARLYPEDALIEVESILNSGPIGDQQAALKVLGTMKGHHAAIDEVLIRLATIAEQPKAIHLEILEAAEALATPRLKKALKAYHEGLNPTDPLSKYAVALEGGDLARGRAIFYNHGAAQCTRCHKGQKNRLKGGVAGPHLKSVGLLHDRAYLLESLFKPNAKIAPGYGTVAVTFKDGTIVGGTLKQKNEREITLADLATGETTSYQRSRIAQMSQPVSTMPSMAGILTKAEARDLVAYLASLKDPAK